MSKAEFVSKYKKTFEEIDMFPGQCRMQLKCDATPELRYKKGVPLALQDRVNIKLRKMEEQGIIKQVNYPKD